MIIREVTLGGTLPFSPTRAQAIARKATGFTARILLKDQRGTFNGKSLLGLLSLGKLSGRVMSLVVDGADEAQAAEEMVLLLEDQDTQTVQDV